MEQGKKIDVAPIKSQASQDYLYTTNTDDSRNVEKALGEIEGAAKQVVELLMQNPSILLSHKQDFNIRGFRNSREAAV